MPTPINTRPVERGSAWSENENTMRFSAKRSGQVSRGRIMSRYRDADLVSAARTLCEYLRSRGTQTDLFDQYRCAERAINPIYGAIGAYDSCLVEALFYWVAANDTDPSIQYTVAERSECVVRGLYEAQRGNNDVAATNNVDSEVINFRDNRSLPDRRICSTGITNKLAEVLNQMHPDVVVFEDILGLIYDLIRGFIAEHLYANGKTYDDLKSTTLDLTNKTLLPEIKTAEIKAKIIEIFGMADSTVYIGFLTRTEVNYIDNCISIDGLDALSYQSCETPDKLQGLIDSANSMLLKARSTVSIRASMQPSDMRSVQVDVGLIRATIISILPEPHWSTYRSSRLADNYEEAWVSTSAQSSTTSRSPSRAAPVPASTEDSFVSPVFRSAILEAFSSYSTSRIPSAGVAPITTINTNASIPTINTNTSIQSGLVQSSLARTTTSAATTRTSNIYPSSSTATTIRPLNYTSTVRTFGYGFSSESNDLWRTLYNTQRRTTEELRATAMQPQPYLTTTEQTIVRAARARTMGI